MYRIYLILFVDFFLLYFSSTVRLVDAATGRKKKLETKFSGSVAGMVFSECGCYLAACVSDSHEIFIFDVQATASSSQAFHIASVSGTPVSLVCRSTDQYVEVLCWFEYGDAVIIRYLFSDDASTNNVYTCNLHTNGPVMSACFGKPGDYSASGATLLLGSQSSPTLHAVEYSSSDSETSILESVSIGTDGLNGAMSTDMVKSSSSKSSKKAATATALEEVAATSTVVLGPFETGGKKRPLLVSDSHLNDSLVVSDHDQDDDGLKSKKTRTRKGSIGSVGSLGSAGDDNESIVSSTRKDLELTIEQRLQQLSSVTTQMEQSHARQVASTIEGRSSSAVPSSDSLVVLIEQALQASDDTLLEQCLNTEDSGVIETTARSLPAPRVIPFLLKLTSKLEKRPARGHVLTIWLGSLIKSHASYLIGFPGIAKQLASLSQMLEQRVSTYVKLTSLSGRLDLIMQQTSFQPNVSTSSNSSNGQGHGSQSVSSDGKANSGSGPKQVYYEE